MPRLLMHRRLWLLVGLIALAFGLRIYQLDSVPLRGDEAYAVRYWADDPRESIRALVDEEPHPVGTFLVFYVWKQVAGDGEFAMRYLPLLGSVIGVAAVAALARRLFHDERVALLAAGLWTVHPFLIWHAQDVRNYALWSGLSPLALALFLRAVDTNRPRTWAAYVLAHAAAFYSFFLEIFLSPLYVLYLLFFRRHRRVLANTVLAWGMLAIVLVPWLGQAYLLSQSGYEGATEDADPARMFSWIVPTLLTGDTFGAPWDTLLSLGWLALVALAVWNTITRMRQRKITLGLWIAVWIVLPPLLLLFAATRMSVFHPRYLIALVPAAVILTARALIPPQRPTLSFSGIRVTAPLLVIVVPLLALATLPGIYNPDPPKAPDWPTLATYLNARVEPEALIVQNMPDPAFDYYYRGAADEASLVPGGDAGAQLRPQVTFYDTIWLVGRAPEAEAYLDQHMQRVSFHTVAGFGVMQFRAWEPAPAEPQHNTAITFGSPNADPIATLRGYTVQGPDATVQALTVLLYWEPLRQTAIDYKVFVHLVGPPQPDGSPLWDQDDHRPQHGFASTLEWQPGTLLRDPYHLLEDPALMLTPGSYTLQVGIYDPETNTRLTAYDADGDPLGDSFALVTLQFPAE